MTNGSADLGSLFRAAAGRWPDAAAVLGDPRWDYRTLDRASDAVAGGLAALGLVPGERIALYCPNCAEFVLAYLGALKAGLVLVPLNLLLQPEALAFQLRDSGCAALIAHGALAENASRARQQAPGVRVGVGIGAAAGDGFGDARLEALTAPRSARPVRPAAGDDAVILYTSGTTGRPKGAVLTHANLATNARAVAGVLALRAGGDRVLVVLPMFHAFAATVGILTPLLGGAALIPVPRFDPQLISRAVATEGATLFLGVPSLYAVLARLDGDAVAGWSSVRLCISGGAALPRAVMDAFEARFGVPILEGDGPTECGPVTCVNPPAGPRKPGSVGPPIPGVEMRIADDDGRPLADGEHGEVCVRGPSVMRGYWNLPEETAQAFHGEWFRTGDLGWRDGDGWFYLIDRIKDLIITNGMNVYPRIIEEALLGHPGVGEVAVVGEPHRAHGEIVVAHVVAAAGQTLDAAALRAWCRERLGRHERPRRFELRDALPRNAAGKVLRRELRRGGEHARGVVRRAWPDLSVYLITDPGMCRTRGLLETVAAAVRGGVTAVQLRDKQAPDAVLIEQGRALQPLLAATGVPLIVNDRVEVAAALGADGLHVGQSDAAAAEARARLGPEVLIGSSVQTVAQARAVDPGVVDYVGVGPVFATATKADHAVPLGFAGLAEVCAGTRVPAVAIGGLGPARAAEVLAAGACGLAVVSAICAARDPERAARALADAVASAGAR